VSQSRVYGFSVKQSEAHSSDHAPTAQRVKLQARRAFSTSTLHLDHARRPASSIGYLQATYNIRSTHTTLPIAQLQSLDLRTAASQTHDVTLQTQALSLLVYILATGTTENAEAENSAWTKTHGWKTRERETWHQNARSLAYVYKELNSL